MSNTEKTNGRVTTEPVPTEVQEPGERRVYTAEYKRQIVAEVTGAPRGQLAAILRRERLYSTTVKSWCDELANKRAPGKPGRKASAETPLKKEIERLRRENARLERKLEHAELIIDVQKKVARLIDSSRDEAAREQSSATE
jgi:transposase